MKSAVASSGKRLRHSFLASGRVGSFFTTLSLYLYAESPELLDSYIFTFFIRSPTLDHPRSDIAIDIHQYFELYLIAFAINGTPHNFT